MRIHVLPFDFRVQQIVTYFYLFIYFANVWHFSLKCYWMAIWKWPKNKWVKSWQPVYWFPWYKTHVVLFNDDALWIVPILIEFPLSARNFCEFISWNPLGLLILSIKLHWSQQMYNSMRVKKRIFLSIDRMDDNNNCLFNGSVLYWTISSQGKKKIQQQRLEEN